MLKWTSILLGLVILCQAIASASWAFQSADGQATASKPASAESLDEASEKAVMEFVREHQPELAELLGFLKSKKTKDYKEAMRESHKVRDRLMSIKDRDAELYEVELAAWKNAAQIRLLAASVSAKSKELSSEDRSKLEALVKRENELAVQRLKLEKTRLESRLSQLAQQLNKRQEQSQSMISKSMKTWETRIERSGIKNKKKETASASGK